MSVVLKQLSSFVLPGSVLILIPWCIEQRPSPQFDLLFVFGLPFLFLGVMVIVVTVTQFMRQGKGTLAPWSPTRYLVTGGMYARVRNPMISGVLCTLLGEALILHSVNIFFWFLGFFFINHIYIMSVEEPGLVRRFGESFRIYRTHVPRWIPGRIPWHAEKQQETEQQM